MESNDSPEIPDRGETSDIPGLPSGDTASTKRTTYTMQEQVLKTKIWRIMEEAVSMTTREANIFGETCTALLCKLFGATKKLALKLI